MPQAVALYLTITTPLASDLFEVISVRGEEHISGLFNYVVEMGSDVIDVDFTKLLGQAVSIGITVEDGTAHQRNGIVIRLSERLDESGKIIYVAVVAPWLWLLTRTSDYRIFQNKSVPDIIKATFSELGLTDFKESLTATYNPREYCTQYGETHFDFISRLMEDEGIFYFFTHQDGKHTMVLADDIDAHADCPGLAAPVRYKRFGASWREEDAVNACTLEHQVITGEYRFTDYNFETPATDLHVSVSAPSAEGPHLAMYEYPGGYLKKDQGESLAKTRIEMFELPMKMIHGAGNCRDFLAGGKFTLKDHYRDDMNMAYVLRSVTMAVAQDQYENTFVAFPATVPFRPPRTTKKPMIHGYQIATVVGKSGEEIWTDQYGRVKVDFPWDTRSKQDENSSCWIRVAQPWAGKGWGTIAIPRMGTEVIISFLGGDPDRPLVTGTVYNGQQTVPYALPDDQTKTAIKTNSSKGGEGFNELRFDDKKGSEQIFIHGEKDLEVRVKNDAHEWIGNEQHLIVTKNQVEKIEGERHRTIKKDQIEKVEGDLHLAVKKDMMEGIDGGRHLTVKGDYNQDIKGGMSLNVGMNLQEKAGQNYAMDAGMAIHLKGGMDVVIEAGMTITLKAGGGFIVVGPAGVTISGTPILLNSGGSAGSGAGSSPQSPKAPKDPSEPVEATDAKPGEAYEPPPARTASSSPSISGLSSAASASSSPASSSPAPSSGGAASSSPAGSSSPAPETPIDPEVAAQQREQAAMLTAAAEDGAPFTEDCVECAKARQEAEARRAEEGPTPEAKNGAL